MPQHTVAFLILETVVLIVFGIGIVGNVVFWLDGAVAPGRQASLGDKIRAATVGVAPLLRGSALAELLMDWLLQRRIFALSRLRWLMHVCFFWGTVILFFVGSVGLMLSERGILPIKKDDPWFALVNDFAGVMILFAVGVAMHRRFVLKERQLRTGPEDIVAIVLLAVIVLSGYGLEASRLIAQEVLGGIGWFSFVGYPLSLALRAANLDWITVEATMWWAHVVAGMSFVAYLPYGKMFHIIATPLAVAANTAGRRAS